jgi:hypothetical protein
LKRKLLFSILAAIPAALFSLTAAGQVSPTGGSAPVERVEPNYKYSVFAGYAYTSLNQINQSRSGLQGVEATVMRDWGKHFGLFADGGYYKYPLKTGNPGTPSVDMVLFGPEFHADLYGHLSGFLRGSLGGAHTGGEGAVPNISFAGGVGGGMNYALTSHISLRASGDDIYSSFVQDPTHKGYSPHMRGNARATFGAVYRF